jgi:hypothetical protein
MSGEIEMNDLTRSKFEAERDTNDQDLDDVVKDYTISVWAWTSTTLFAHFA